MGRHATAYSGAMEGQGAKFSSGALLYDDSSLTAVDTGTYTLISGGLPSDTYTIGYIDGTLTIAPRRQRGLNFTH